MSLNSQAKNKAVILNRFISSPYKTVRTATLNLSCMAENEVCLKQAKPATVGYQQEKHIPSSEVFKLRLDVASNNLI